jgi:hypothetical protein
MLRVLGASVLSSGILFSSIVAEAQNQIVPSDTGAFVTYCAGHLEACRLAVVDVNNDMMMKQMGGNHGCSLPKPSSADPALRKDERRVWTLAILDWLKANSSVRVQKTNDAIAQAMKALWPKECR